MEIVILNVNKTKSNNLKNLLNDYKQRIGHYIKFSTTSNSDMKNSKNLSPKEQKEKKGVLIQKKLN
jgi:23S rRNA (pseudouridine1915-N3)-methyltransferase